MMDPEGQEELYCICKRANDPSRFMVGCDGCFGWFHLDCVNTTRAEVRKMKTYLCPTCKAQEDEGTDNSRASVDIEEECVSTLSSMSTPVPDDPLEVSNINATEAITEGTVDALSGTAMPATTFRHDLCPENTFSLERQTWHDLGGIDGSGRLRPQWCDTFAHQLKSSNPYCSFAFKRHWVKRSLRKRSELVFKSNGHCTFEGCPVMVTLGIASDQCSPGQRGPLEVRVRYEGFVSHHADERRARHIRGTTREMTMGVVSRYTPSYIRHQGLLGLSGDVFASGNRDGIGRSRHVLQKIASEGRQALRLDATPIPALQILRHALIKEDENSSTIKGYIQEISAVPFRVVCFTEAGVRLYHDLARTSQIHCDATGTIVAHLNRHNDSKSAEETAHLLYYALVLQHPVKGEPPLAVAEMVSAEQSAFAVEQFLGRFRRAESLLFNYRHTSPPYVILDRSLVLLIAFLKEYNNESIRDFLHRAFRIVQGNAVDRDLELTIPHACCSHVMKDAKEDIKQSTTKKAYQMMMYIFGVLVNSYTLEYMSEVLAAMKIIVSSSHVTRQVQVSYEWINREFSRLGGVDDKHDDDEGGESTDLTDEKETPIESSTSPFLTYIKARLEKTTIATAKKGLSPNPLYNPKILEMLMKKWIPTAPFWSNMLLGDLSRYNSPFSSHEQSLSVFYVHYNTELAQRCRTNGTVEQWNFLVKRKDHQLTRMRPDEFLLSHHSVVKGRQRLFVEGLKEEQKRALRSRKRSGAALKEEWAKRPKRDPPKDPTKGRYQQPPPKPFPKKLHRQQKSKKQTPPPPPPLERYSETELDVVDLTVVETSPAQKKATASAKAPKQQRGAKGKSLVFANTKGHRHLPKKTSDSSSRQNTDETELDVVDLTVETSPARKLKRGKASAQAPKQQRGAKGKSLAFANKKGHRYLPKKTSHSSSRQNIATLAVPTLIDLAKTSSINNLKDPSVQLSNSSGNDNDRTEENQTPAEKKSTEEPNCELISASSTWERSVPNLRKGLVQGPLTQSLRKGFVNSGSACWLNACLQILQNTSIIFVIEGVPASSRTPSQKLYFKLYRDIVDSRMKVLSAHQLKKSLQSCTQSLWNKGRQQDVPEAMSNMLEQLLGKDAEVESMVYKQLFEVEVAHVCTCTDCGHEVEYGTRTSTTVLMTEQIVSEAVSNHQSIADLVQHHIETPVVPYHLRVCSWCNGQSYITRMDFVRAPKYLIVAMPRGHLGSNGVQHKLQVPVEISRKVGVVLTSERGSCDIEYNICGAMVHVGRSAHSGHYVAYVSTPSGWLMCDDEFLQTVQEAELDTNYSQRNIYLALYQSNQVKCPVLAPADESPTPTIVKKDPKITTAVSPKEEEEISQFMKKGHKQGFMNPLLEDKVSYETLKPGQLVDDEVINKYLKLLTRSSISLTGKTAVALTSFLYEKLETDGYRGVKTFSKRAGEGGQSVNLFEVDLVMIPINLQNCNHWVLVVVYPQLKVIAYLDSMKATVNDYVINMIWHYLCCESLYHHSITLNGKEWKFCGSRAMNMPFQHNGYDCGVFVCMAARYITQGWCLDFHQKHMKAARKRILQELLYGSLV